MDAQDYSLFDNIFMTATFDDQPEAIQEVLRIILGRDDINVLSSKAQVYYPNLMGHEAQLDIVAADDKKVVYNTEVQQKKKDAPVQRFRYDASILDITLLKKGAKYKDLPDRYTIFICDYDPQKKGLPVYNASYTIKELDHQELGDGSHIVLVNGKYKGKDKIGDLMRDFHQKDPKKIKSDVLRSRVEYLKNTQKGREELDKITQMIFEEKLMEVARRLLAQGRETVEGIAAATGLDLEVVKELAKNMTA